MPIIYYQIYVSNRTEIHEKRIQHIRVSFMLLYISAVRITIMILDYLLVFRVIWLHGIYVFTFYF